MKLTSSNCVESVSWRASASCAALVLLASFCAACVAVDSREVVPADLGSGGSSASEAGSTSRGGSATTSGGSSASNGGAAVSSGGAAVSGGGSKGQAGGAGTSSGAGGHSGSGAGGSGGLVSSGAGAGGVSSAGASGVCLNLKADPSAPLLDDLDVLSTPPEQEQIAQQSGRVGYWFAYNDGSSCTETPALSTPFVATAGGALSTPGAARMNGQGCLMWGAGMGFDFNRGNNIPVDKACSYDVSAFTGISFYAKSTTLNNFNVLVPMLSTENSSIGGNCVSTATVQCDDHYQQIFPAATATWTAYQIAFKQLKQAGFGKVVPFDATQVVGVRFQTTVAASATSPYDLWVDQISFY